MGTPAKIAAKVMPYFGILLTLLVVGSLVFLHFSKAEVPREGEWASTPKVLVCPDAPDWASGGNLQEALNYWGELGFDKVRDERSLCANLCDTVGPDGKARHVPCTPGHISIALAGSGMNMDHFGLTLRPAGETEIPWATILVPHELSQDQTEGHTEMLPAEVHELTLAHELGHAFGWGHVKTEIIPGVIGRPSGHIMHPSIYKTGWDAEGIE